ncbi:hypothetical protein SY89_02714 [Halolamina pelagica]|uniref:Uncharacterized protein n=1 Tax=Halolamina pelagica TaxID=699431 RepID=A0A0P7GSQ9_9EURY|nr:hypothetical protein SY89_02714 [Halolamina pelagica]
MGFISISEALLNGQYIPPHIRQNIPNRNWNFTYCDLFFNWK